MKTALEIRKLISDKDQELFDLISNASDEEILNHYAAMLKYLNQPASNHHKMEFFLNDDNQLDWKYVASSKEAKQLEKISKLRENFLIGYENHFDHLLSMSDVRVTSERMSLLKTLKNLSANLEENPKGLWIYGKSGIGKTHIIKSFANYMALKGNITSFLFLPEMITILQSFIKAPNSSNEINSFLERAKEADFLVIDDITSGNIGPWVRDTFLFPLLDHRSKTKKLTVITSNGKIKDFERRLKLAGTPKQDEEASDRIIVRILDLVEEQELK